MLSYLVGRGSVEYTGQRVKAERGKKWKEDM